MPVTTPSVRWNPLRTYQFRVGILGPPPDDGRTGTFLGTGATPSPAAGAPADQRYVAGVTRVSGLNLTVAAHEIREGGNALHRYAVPDRATWDPITLEQGLAIDDTLERWAGAAVAFLRTGTVPDGEPVKRNVVVDVWDPALPSAERVRRFLVFNAWVSRYQALPQLDARTDEVALVTVELTHEGWRGETPPTFERAATAAERGG